LIIRYAEVFIYVFGYLDISFIFLFDVFFPMIQPPKFYFFPRRCLLLKKVKESRKIYYSKAIFLSKKCLTFVKINA